MLLVENSIKLDPEERLVFQKMILSKKIFEQHLAFDSKLYFEI